MILDSEKELFLPTAITVQKNGSPSISLTNSPINSWKLQKYLDRNPILKVVIPATLIAMLLLFLYAFKNTTKLILIWIESQNSWIVFVIFLLLFALVSFPLTIGYLILIISSGYLFGFVKGICVVIVGANLGVAIAHNTIKSVQSKLPIHRLAKNEMTRAILRLIAGPKAFKIVLMARLTPIPFGLQNTIFGISSVNSVSYHTATLIGLLPAQIINCYLGSKLRSIHDVLNDHHTAMAGYGMFVFEVLMGAGLMIWVIQKARSELSAVLIADMTVDEKLIIQVDV